MALEGQLARSRLHVVGALLFVALGAATPGRAFALEPDQHQTITNDGCQAAGLPVDFCRRAGVAAHEVDADEWADLTAHAQSVAPEDLCGSANAAVARLIAVGQSFFDALGLAEYALADPTGADAASASVGMATALGRAVHTVQDNCAHRGVSDPQHAWSTRSAMCDGPVAELDDDPAAKECARAQTEALLALIEPVIADAGVADMLGNMSCVGSRWDDPCSGGDEANVWEACEFLGTATLWDGVDRRWNVTVVGPELEAAFVYGTANDLCSFESIAAPPDAPIDVSGGPAECVVYDVMCLGGGSSPNGWECFGCAGARPREGAATGAALLALVGLLALGRRRQG